MELKVKEKSDILVSKWVSKLNLDEPTVFSVRQIAENLKLSPTTVKFRLEILRALGVVEVDSKVRKYPKIKRLK